MSASRSQRGTLRQQPKAIEQSLLDSSRGRDPIGALKDARRRVMPDRFVWVLSVAPAKTPQMMIGLQSAAMALLRWLSVRLEPIIPVNHGSDQNKRRGEGQR